MIPVFVLVYLLVDLAWHVPAWVAALYVVASAVCFATYALDKSAAHRGRWRVPESRLLLMGLAGGWPGAIFAQRVLRHKSAKASFQAAFRFSVAVNIVAFVMLNSPLAWRLPH